MKKIIFLFFLTSLLLFGCQTKISETTEKETKDYYPDEKDYQEELLEETEEYETIKQTEEETEESEILSELELLSELDFSELELLDDFYLEMQDLEDLDFNDQ
jgi:hypothetical protein